MPYYTPRFSTKCFRICPLFIFLSMCKRQKCKQPEVMHYYAHFFPLLYWSFLSVNVPILCFKCLGIFAETVKYCSVTLVAVKSVWSCTYALFIYYFSQVVMFYNVFWQISVTRSVIKINISFWLLWDVVLFSLSPCREIPGTIIIKKPFKETKWGSKVILCI